MSKNCGAPIALVLNTPLVTMNPNLMQSPQTAITPRILTLLVSNEWLNPKFPSRVESYLAHSNKTLQRANVHLLKVS